MLHVYQYGLHESVTREGCQNSFVRGTKVLLANGKMIPIEKVHVGTRVMSVDENRVTARPAGSKVVGLIRHADADLYYLTVDRTTIQATGNHPFFAKGRGWVTVRSLRAGMVLREYSGKLVRLTRIVRLHRSAITVYNFEVADGHTYFAGKASVLVHNACGDIPAMISEGHAWAKHAGQYPELNSATEFADLIRDVIHNPDEVRDLAEGRTAYWQAASDTVVIHDPSSPDQGTAFRPADGYVYFRDVLE